MEKRTTGRNGVIRVLPKYLSTANECSLLQSSFQTKLVTDVTQEWRSL